MSNDADLVVTQAKLDAALAREQVLTTFRELRRRTSLKVMAADLSDHLVARAGQLVNDTTTSARRRPALTAGGAAAFAFAVGLRIWFAKRRRHFDAT